MVIVVRSDARRRIGLGVDRHGQLPGQTGRELSPPTDDGRPARRLRRHFVDCYPEGTPGGVPLGSSPLRAELDVNDEDLR